METYTDYLKRLATDTGGETGKDIKQAAKVIDELAEALELCLDAVQPYYDNDADGSKEANASNTALAALAGIPRHAT